MTVYSADWVLPVESEPIRNGAVAVEHGAITAVGTRDELGEGERFESGAILPGFVNAHSHLEYAVYAGFGDGLADFAEWLSIHIERKARLDHEAFEAIARFGAAECLRAGITCTGDASFSGAAAPALDELGLRGIVYLEVFGAGTEQLATRFEANRDRYADSFTDRVRLGVSPHAPYSASLELYAACRELALPTATHLAETASEQQWLSSGTGAWEPLAHLLLPPPGTTGIRLLAGAGLLHAGIAGAHCVAVDGEEIALLAEHDVAVAHCPRSNALLGCGIAPLRELLDAGIRVGIGTDSPASAPSFDMFDELRAAVMGARARQRRPDAIGAGEALELATLGSARALGLDTEVGSLAPGKRADLTVVSLEGSPYLPWEDPAGAVVFGGSPSRVLLTVVDGTERYRRGTTEWHELTAAAHAARGRLLASEPAARPAQ